ncbi:hypothetical protein [Bradyrhizobium cenepequi]
MTSAELVDSSERDGFVIPLFFFFVPNLCLRTIFAQTARIPLKVRSSPTPSRMSGSRTIAINTLA